VEREMMLIEGDIVDDLHFVKQPIGIALEDLRQVNPYIPGRFTEAVHDAAQRRFMNAKHSGEAILPNAGGVHAQLKIWVDVSIQAHRDLALLFVLCLAVSKLGGYL
jgi:hypothetical protein